MKRVELYGRVRHAVMIEGLSQREAARCFGIDPRTVRKMLSYSVPPGYVRTRPPVRPKLDPFIGIIDRILEEDKDRPKKQRHTSKRIFERLRDEYGFTGKITIVKDYICGVRQRRREMFVPLTHPPGHAQVDFGEALAVIGGVERKIHFLAMSLPHSDACFVKAYPGETTEAFCDGHVSGFSFFGGVPRSILYDNTRIAVARILGDGKRQRTRVFSELRSHYLFEDRFGRPGKGNDKGKVEGIVGYCRRNFLVPMPRFRNFDDLNTHLEACCAKRWAEQLRGHDQTVGERLERDRAVLQRLPAIAYDACDKRPGRVSSLSLVRYRGTDYSVPTRFGHCEVLVRGYVHEVVISCAAEVTSVAGSLSAAVRHYSGAWHGSAIARCWSAAISTLRRRWSRSARAAEPPLLPGTRVHTSKRTSSSIRCTICPCWSKRSTRWIRRLPWPAGCCRRCSAISAAYLKRGWAKPGSGNTSRCCG